MSEVSNYEVTKKNTAKLFLERDQEEIIRRCGLTADDASIFVMFFGRRYRVDRRTGVILAIGGLHQTVLRSKTDAMRSERTKLIQL